MVRSWRRPIRATSGAISLRTPRGRTSHARRRRRSPDATSRRAKVAGRYLAPYLADQRDLFGVPHEPDVEAAAATARDRADARRLAVDFAEADAEWGDHRSALRWLETVERLDGMLSPELAERRERWERLAAGSEVREDVAG